MNFMGGKKTNFIPSFFFGRKFIPQVSREEKKPALPFLVFPRKFRKSVTYEGKFKKCRKVFTCERKVEMARKERKKKTFEKASFDIQFLNFTRRKNCFFVKSSSFIELNVTIESSSSLSDPLKNRVEISVKGRGWL